MDKSDRRLTRPHCFTHRTFPRWDRRQPVAQRAPTQRTPLHISASSPLLPAFCRPPPSLLRVLTIIFPCFPRFLGTGSCRLWPVLSIPYPRFVAEWQPGETAGYQHTPAFLPIASWTGFALRLNYIFRATTRPEAHLHRSNTLYPSRSRARDNEERL